jgi:hypothetical protein
VTLLDEPHQYDKNEEFQKFASFDCRGLEPIDWNPIGNDFVVELSSGTVLDQVSLEEREYYGK